MLHNYEAFIMSHTEFKWGALMSLKQRYLTEQVSVYKGVLPSLLGISLQSRREAGTGLLMDQYIK